MAIRIFIGSEPKTSIQRDVLKFSILQNTKEKVNFYPLEADESWRTKRKSGYRSTLGTGFSLLRWDIPERCNYRGSAIYMDSDQLVFGDVKDLWEQDIRHPSPGCSIWCTYQAVWGKKDKFKEFPSSSVSPETSVMLIDCAAAKDNQPNMEAIIPFIEKDDDRSNYIKIMRCAKHKVQPQEINVRWNRLNKHIYNDTCLLHYTQEPKQPWYNPNHAHAKLWLHYLNNAVKEGFISIDRIKEAIASFEPPEHKIRAQGLHPYFSQVIENNKNNEQKPFNSIF